MFAARQNKRLERAIGEALRLIEQDSIEEGLDCFYARTGEFSAAEFDYRVSELLPKISQKDSFLVSACGEEVNILRSLMQFNVRKRLNSADRDKVSSRGSKIILQFHSNGSGNKIQDIGTLNIPLAQTIRRNIGELEGQVAPPKALQQ